MTQQFSSQSTDSFKKLLNLANYSLMVSTYQAGQLVVVRSEDKGINTHFLGFDRPMGIALKDNEIALGEQSTITLFRNLADVGAKIGQGDKVDACYVPRKTYYTGAIDTHEMGYDKQGKLWFVNTKMSCLATLSHNYSFEPQWKPPFISAYDLTDRCHLNGLAFRNGIPRYISLLGAYDSAAGWRQNKISGGQIIDIQTNKTIADGLCMPHSPRWYRGKLYYLSSGTGQLMSMTPGQEPSVIAQLPGFVRGMDFIDRYALIGLSQIRETSTFAGLPITKRVEKRESGVWVVDLETGEIVAYLIFTGNVQEVFEVKVLPHNFASIIDKTNPLIAHSFELPAHILKKLAPIDPIQEALDKATKYHSDGNWKKTIISYQNILKQDSNHLQTNFQLGLCYLDATMWQQAIKLLSKVCLAQPDNAEAMNSLGYAYSQIGNQTKAMEYFNASISVDNQFALAHFNRGLLLLKQGLYKQAWPEYDWRWQTDQFISFQSSKPKWKGEDISNKRLLVHSEQGTGDHVQYWRFLTLVAKQCKGLIYIGPENTAALVAEIDGVTESRVPGEISDDRYDVWCPLMSLTRWLNITLDNIPAPNRYLNIPANAIVSELQGGFRVGLAWAGSKSFKNDSTRSIKLEQFKRLFDIEGATFFSLQMPISKQEREALEKHGVQNLEAELPGYARTAALVEQLDLVISVDTAIAHIAAALGKPTWTLLSSNPDWRWLDSGNTSPWYPTISLYRQTKNNPNWIEVIDKVKVDLVRLISEKYE